MSEESKNLGKRLPCPECRSLFTKAADIKDLASGKIYIQNNCRFCNTPITIEMGVKPYVKIYKTLKIAGFVLIVLSNLYLTFSLIGLNKQVTFLINNYEFESK